MLRISTSIFQLDPPNITESSFPPEEQTDRQIFKEDSPTSFFCAAVGYPQPNITWILNGEDITPHHTVTVDTHTDGGSITVVSNITILQVGHAMTGKLKCVADNGEEPTSSFATSIQVECKLKRFFRDLINQRYFIRNLRYYASLNF